ncbi:CopY/TcrY family copper transport repressor [Virgibacillus salinus]|uniref:Copper transport repressor, CopY/TcrY family n=1 Tax=Virgibacillus salinus TaxID=553311 RepID=A0A1H1EL46_9BACI|nr:CopY/TcrY family copper transport repressor [Virgibacillus salinus]SDQ89467.1 copper transport repressor, CopY/TcrY family [Virgibacillus salinus]
MAIEEKIEITESEWEIMRVVWTLEKATSKDIIQVLQDKKDWKPATAKTFIGRLVKKGMLNTEPKGNKYIYSAAFSEEDSVKSVTDRLFDQICSKEVGKTIADMIAGATLSHKDIELLQTVLDKKKDEAVDEVACNCMPGQCKCRDNHNMN